MAAAWLAARRAEEPLSPFLQAAAALPARPFEACLDGWPYAPPPRGGAKEASPGPEELRLRGAAGELLKAGQAPLTTVAAAHLAIGSTTTAIEELRRAAAHTRDAAVWSDLAAALLVHADAIDDGDTAVDALAAADHALSLDPHHGAAHFNRALALNRLGLMAEARHEWQAASATMRDASWAAEALRRIHDVPMRSETEERKQAFAKLDGGVVSRADITRMVERIPQAMRAYGESLCLCAWATALQQGDAVKASAKLRLAGMIGDELRARSGELLLSDAVAAADRSVAAGTAAMLAKAHLLYCGARQEHNANHASAAKRDFVEAERLFAAARSPMALVARYYTGSALHAQLRLAESQALLDALAATKPESKGYRALAAQIGWERGLCIASRGTPATAVTVLAASRDLFAALGETANEASLDSMLADTYDYLGESAQAWRARRSALRALERSGDVARCVVALSGASGKRVRDSQWERAGALANVGAAIATRSGVYNTYVLSLQSIIDRETGDDARSAARLADAKRWLASIKDNQMRRMMSADVAMADGYAAQKRDPEAALRYFTEALDFYRSTSYRMPMPRVLLERGRALRALNRPDDAASDFVQGIEIMEELRRSIPNVLERAAAFQEADEIFDEAMSLELERGHRERAFNLSERARARILLDTYNGDARPLLTLHDIQSSLAADAAIVEYVVAAGRTFAFVVTSSHCDVMPIDRAALFAPLRPFLHGVATIAFVPDRYLSSVSFGGLPDGTRRVLDDYIVLQSPSANVAILASQRARRATGPIGAVAAMEFDRKRYPSLQPLEWVQTEAARIAALSPSSEVIGGTGATPEAFTRALSHFPLVHFGGHAIADPRNAVTSRLLLSGGEMTAGEIAALRLNNAPGVVLSACRSAAASESRDGAVSLAVAFLIAGAPSVVASTFDVDDRAAAEMSVELYRQMLRTGDAAAALHEAAKNRKEAASMMVLGGSTRLVRRDERREK